MRISTIAIYFVIILSSFGCVDRYVLEDQINFESKLVVDCTITDECQEQTITLSYSSSTDQALFIPCTSATVYVTDSLENQFHFYEDHAKPGIYTCVIENEYLLTGASFVLTILTEDGETYKSTREKMLPCPEIDSLYSAIEYHATSNADVSIPGVQFYVDFDASNYFGRYYRWVVEETYEFHSTWPKEYYIDGRFTWVRGPLDFSTFRCYKTQNVNDVFTLTTDRLVENSYIKSPLHFVSDRTQRLMYNYSVLLKQRSLSPSAYNYWTNIKQNNQETVGFYSKQPAISKGNVFNVSDSSEVVLGYFGVSSEVTKRLTLDAVSEFNYEDVMYCSAIRIGVVIPPSPRPLYLVEEKDVDGNMFWAFAKTECFDCTLLGGKLEKPEFFEK